MNNDELKELIEELVGYDEEELNQIIVLEGDEFADGAIGLTDDNHIIYDYEKLVESLSKQEDMTEEDAIDWLEFNTIPSIPYMSSYGKEPIIMTRRFSDYR